VKPDSPFKNLIGIHSEVLTEVVSHCISALPFHYLFVAYCSVYVLYGCLQVVQVGDEVKDFFSMLPSNRKHLLLPVVLVCE